MSPIARIIKSRNKWKKRSLERRKEAESKARQAAKWKERYYKAEDKLATANIKIKNIESKFSKIPVPIVQVNVRVVCVFLFFLGVISCRAIPRVLNFLHKIQQLPFNRIPHWSSVANWVCRAGLGLFQSVEPWENRRWIAIIDTSISYSTKKVLVVLRLPLDHFLKKCP